MRDISDRFNSSFNALDVEKKGKVREEFLKRIESNPSFEVYLRNFSNNEILTVIMTSVLKGWTDFQSYGHRVRGEITRGIAGYLMTSTAHMEKDEEDEESEEEDIPPSSIHPKSARE